MTASSLGLTPEDLEALLGILERYVPGTEIWAFGSRIKGTARPFSDLDLVVVNDRPLTAQARAELNYALSESNLPIKMDLIEWARTSPDFRDVILQNHQILKAKAA